MLFRSPRCHQLALHAARQALAGSGPAPDAVVLGTTTGGMLTTERFLAAHEARPGANPYHSLHTVTAAVAELAGCRGPALTVSTACSSGALALALALRLLRSGRAGRVLAGGVDSLCRLTYFGFHALQLVDADRLKPLVAIKALGGVFQARLDPHTEEEIRRCKEIYSDRKSVV